MVRAPANFAAQRVMDVGRAARRSFRARRGNVHPVDPRLCVLIRAIHRPVKKREEQVLAIGSPVDGLVDGLAMVQEAHLTSGQRGEVDGERLHRLMAFGGRLSDEAQPSPIG